MLTFVQKNERGKLCILLDSLLLRQNIMDVYMIKDKGLNYKVFNTEMANYLNFLSQPDLNESFDIKLILEQVNFLSHINNYNYLTSMLKSAFCKEYIGFCDLFYGPLHNKIMNPDTIYYTDPVSTNVLNSMLFVITDKKLFIDTIRKQGYDVNEGPQK